MRNISSVTKWRNLENPHEELPIKHWFYISVGVVNSGVHGSLEFANDVIFLETHLHQVGDLLLLQLQTLMMKNDENFNRTNMNIEP